MQGSAIDSTQVDLNHSPVAHAADHHHAHPDLRIFGLIVFLISEGMLFIGLFAAYLTYRAVAPAWPPAGTPTLEVLLPGINTVILVSSSFVIHQADKAIKKNDVSAARGWFLATLLMGATFLGGQIYEYYHLEFGLTSHLFGSTFFVLTGFHGFHVFVGLTLISSVILKSLRPGYYSAENHFGIEAASVYWHFVDIIWVVLFAMLYIL